MLKEILQALCRSALCGTTFLDRTAAIQMTDLMTPSAFTGGFWPPGALRSRQARVRRSNINRQAFPCDQGPGTRLGRRRADAVHLVIVMLGIVVKQTKRPGACFVGQPNGLLPA